MDVLVVEHPLAQSRLTVMRNKNSGNAEFRNALRELATLLVYEATRGLAIAPVEIETPLGPTDRHGAGQPAADRAGAAGGPRHGRGRVQPACRSRRWGLSGWPVMS